MLLSGKTSRAVIIVALKDAPPGRAEVVVAVLGTRTHAQYVDPALFFPGAPGLMRSSSGSGHVVGASA